MIITSIAFVMRSTLVLDPVIYAASLSGVGELLPTRLLLLVELWDCSVHTSELTPLLPF